MREHIATIILALLLTSAAALAQPNVERFERQLEQSRQDTFTRSSQGIPIDQRSFYEFGAYTTFNYLSLDDSAENNRGLRQYDFTAYARFNLDDVHDVFVRGRGFYRDFNDGDSVDEDVNGWDGRLERAYYKFDFARYLSATKGQQSTTDFSIKVGRDLSFWANGMTLSQELDGVVIDFGTGPVALQLIAGITPLDTVDIDSSRPDFDDHTKRGFYGALLSTRVGEKHRPYVYALMQRDYNDDETLVTDLNGTDVTTNFEYNSNYFGIGSTGALTDRTTYGVEFVYETGDTLSNSFSLDSSGNVTAIPQERDDIHAWGVNAQIDYLLPDERHTRFSGEFMLASGDSDRLVTSTTFGGNEPGTKDNAFNAYGLLNTGLAFAPTPSNLIVLRGGMSTFPFVDVKYFRRFQFGADSFVFAKMDKDAPIDELTTDDRMLGFEQDFYINWQMSSDVTLALRYGAFVPGEAIVADGKIRQFFYAGVTFAF